MSELQNYLDKAYTVLLRRDNDGDYVARIPELPGCSAHGKTTSEALENLEEAKALWIQDCLENGEEVPLPSEEEVLPSGKWLQRVPRKLHRKLQILAKNEGVSLNQLVTALLAEAVGERPIDRTQAPTLSHEFATGHYHSALGLLNPDMQAHEWQVVNVTAGAVTLEHYRSAGLVERLNQWSSQLPDKITFKAEKNEKEKHRSFASL
jgi:antitoxin HicB